jgi:hypothetical protein
MSAIFCNLGPHTHYTREMEEVNVTKLNGVIRFYMDSNVGR